MSNIKLDQQRSYNEEKYVCYGRIDKLYYYQINNSDELCCCVNYLRDIKKVEEIGEKISVNPSFNDDTPPTIYGEFRVTTMLVNIDCDSNEFKFASKRIDLPSFIERVYFSDKYAGFSQNPWIEMSDDNRSICLISDEIFKYRRWYYSSNRKELFRYDDNDGKTSQDIVLPNGLETIHRFAFMCAEHIGTLRIPASVKEIGKGAFLNAKIKKIIFEGKWTKDIDAEAFSGLEDPDDVEIHINDTAQNLCLHADFRWAKGLKCRTLSLVAPGLCDQDSPAIGYIRVTRSYYRDSKYLYEWNNDLYKDGIIDINTRYIASVQEYDIPAYSTHVKGSVITLYGCDNEHQQYNVIVYEPVAMVLEKIDSAVKQLNATGCTVDELIDRINSKIK